MTTTPTLAPAPSTSTAASSRLLLWLPVPAFAVVGVLLTKGYTAVLSASIDDYDMFGFGYVLIAGACALFALVAGVIALSTSFGGAPTRSYGVLAAAVWTAISGAGFAAFCAVADEAGAAGLSWYVAAGVAAVVPLVVAVVVRSTGRTH